MGVFLENTGDISAISGAGTWHNASHWTPSIIPGGVGKKAVFPTVANGVQTIDDHITLQFLVLNNTAGAVNFNTSTGKIIYFKAKIGTGNCIISGTTNRANNINCNVVFLDNLDITANGGSLAFNNPVSGTINITKSGSVILIMGASHIFIGTLNFSSGSIVAGSNNAFGDVANIVTMAGSSILNGVASSTFVISNPIVINTGFSTNTGNVEFAGAVSGSGGITFSAGNIYIISGTYSAGAIVSNGAAILKITGTHSSASGISGTGALVILGSITNSSGTVSCFTISGTGTCAKAVSQTSSSVLEPGNGGVGTLTLTNGLTMSNTGIYSIRTSGATTSKLAVTGNVIIRGTYSLPDSSLTAGTYDIITYTGTATVTTLTSSGVNNTGRTITFFHDTVNKKYQMIAV